MTNGWSEVLPLPGRTSLQEQADEIGLSESEDRIDGDG